MASGVNNTFRQVGSAVGVALVVTMQSTGRGIAGYRADLVAVEETGRLVIIETKRAANPEARQAVIAQVLHERRVHGRVVVDCQELHRRSAQLWSGGRDRAPRRQLPHRKAPSCARPEPGVPRQGRDSRGEGGLSQGEGPPREGKGPHPRGVSLAAAPRVVKAECCNHRGTVKTTAGLSRRDQPFVFGGPWRGGG